MRAMFITKLKIAIALLLLLGLVTAGATYLPLADTGSKATRFLAGPSG